MLSNKTHIIRRRPFVFGGLLTGTSTRIPASKRVLHFAGNIQALRRIRSRIDRIGLGVRRASTDIPVHFPPLPQRRPLFLRFLYTLGLLTVFVPIGFLLSAGGLVETIREMEAVPTDEETLLLVNPVPEDPAHEINKNIIHHPLAKELYEDPKFIAARPHLKIPPSLRMHNFTGGTLVGPDMIPVPPLVFSTDDGTELIQIQYLGAALCGHPGIVHGGMLATLLDEGLARCCFPGLPNKVAVTASLKVDYRKPCMAEQYVVLKAVTEKFEGRKAWVKGRVETLPLDGSPGVVLVEAEALFIEPRNAGFLSRGSKIVGGDSSVSKVVKDNKPVDGQ